jgi:hypothetical protein
MFFLFQVLFYYFFPEAHENIADFGFPVEIDKANSFSKVSKIKTMIMHLCNVCE